MYVSFVSENEMEAKLDLLQIGKDSTLLLIISSGGEGQNWGGGVVMNNITVSIFGVQS